MREILFKAKRIDNGEWVYGNYAFCDCYTKQKHYIFQNKPLEYAVDENTLCQYTGLTDRNGITIWENDVIKCIDKNSDSEFIAVIKFGNPNSFYSWGYQLKHINGDKPNLDILLWIDMEDTGATCEVIGNIFDNPELLGGMEC